MLTKEKIKEIIIAAGENTERIHRRPQMCGCYHCMSIFPSDEIDEDNAFGAPSHKPYSVCEYCGLDAIICEDDLEGLAPLNEDTLKAIHEVAFNIEK